tara:strand:- start:374 stop:634 length:261 start_codon:yes stop_codon:yes gene_type:complete
MSWFLVAIMMTVYDGGKKDIYVWHNPSFESSQQCLDFVEDNQQGVFTHLRKQFPDDKLEKLICVPEDKLRNFLDYWKKQQQGQQSL